MMTVSPGSRKVLIMMSRASSEPLPTTKFSMRKPYSLASSSRNPSPYVLGYCPRFNEALSFSALVPAGLAPRALVLVSMRSLSPTLGL